MSGLQGRSEDAQSPALKVSSDMLAKSTSTNASSSQTIKMNISSIQSQTHFAPVQQLSPTQQIADFVTASAGSMTMTGASDGPAAVASSTTTTATAATTAVPVTPTSVSPVKTLTLALEPDALGTVTVKMRLVDSGLELQVEAEKSETASLIEKDKGNLSEKLQSVGYSVDSLVVSTAAAHGSQLDRPNDQMGSGQAPQSANDASASSSSQNGGRNANDQSPAPSGGESTSSPDTPTAVDSPSVRTLSDGIYV
jgi:hypothetical protein